MTTENRNEYIDQAIVDDCHNDLMVTMTLRSCIQDAIKVTMKFQSEGAMAFNGELLTDVIAKLDDILAEQIAPIDQKIEEGISFHEERSNAA
jgi:hypothetical protein